MSVSLLNINYNTNYCEFSYDDWNVDKNSLPTLNTPGKDSLSTVKSCIQGSIAIGTDGSIKILRGSDNKWIDFE